MCSRFGYPGQVTQAGFPRLRSNYHGTDTISEVRNVPHTHPVFNPVPPTTHSSNARVARSDTKTSGHNSHPCYVWKTDQLSAFSNNLVHLLVVSKLGPKKAASLPVRRQKDVG